MEGIGEMATECEKRKYGGRKRGAVGKGNKVVATSIIQTFKPFSHPKYNKKIKLDLACFYN